MTLTQLQEKMPELTYDVGMFLDAKDIPYKTPFFGERTIEDEHARKAIELFYKEYGTKCAKNKERAEQWKLEQDRLEMERELEREEELRKKRAMSQMLVTSGFNFDGYRIVKYSGYISGDDAMTVSRGSSFTDGGVRDKLMASLTQIRRNALRELKEAAYDLGCNAVIGVDFDYITLDPQTANLSGGTTYQPYVFCVTANGNAVIIEKIEE